MGFNGLSWVLLGSSWFDYVFMGFTRFSLVSPVFIRVFCKSIEQGRALNLISLQLNCKGLKRSHFTTQVTWRTDTNPKARGSSGP